MVTATTQLGFYLFKVNDRNTKNKEQTLFLITPEPPTYFLKNKINTKEKEQLQLALNCELFFLLQF